MLNSTNIKTIEELATGARNLTARCWAASMMWACLHSYFMLGLLNTALADCYPGDDNFTAILQDLYHSVTSDRINFGSTSDNKTMDRNQLCSILTNQHNYGKNTGQSKSNQDFLGQSFVSQSECTQALTVTRGYDSISGWQLWTGYYTGKWYFISNVASSDSEWSEPSHEMGDVYSLQTIRFDSADRVSGCVTEDMTGATCCYSWNKSGKNVQYLWRWDPKEDGCNGGGRIGSHVGFLFDSGPTHCIVWVTTEEAFLECLKDARRTSTITRGINGSEIYGQWEMRGSTTARSDGLDLKVVLGSVGASVGGILLVTLVVLIVALIIVKYRRKKKQALPQQQQPHLQQFEAAINDHFIINDGSPRRHATFDRNQIDDRVPIASHNINSSEVTQKRTLTHHYQTANSGYLAIRENTDQESNHLAIQMPSSSKNESMPHSLATASNTHDHLVARPVKHPKHKPHLFPGTERGQSSTEGNLATPLLIEHRPDSEHGAAARLDYRQILTTTKAAITHFLTKHS